MATSGIKIVAGRAQADKDPNAVLDYEFDWTAWLAAHAPVDTIIGVDVLVEGCTRDAYSFTPQRVFAWILGGVVGVDAKVTCRITTAAGRTNDRTLTLKIKEL